MAEAFFNKIAGDKMYVESAGLEPKPVNPLVVEVMQEIGSQSFISRTPNPPGG
jgi:protein-tyrosine-phosphatase